MAHEVTATDPQAVPARRESYGIRPPGFRLPADLRLGRVVLQVADLERSLAFYRDLLGFRVLERRSERLTMGAHGDDAPLVALHQQDGARPVPRRGRLGLYHFAVLLPHRGALGALLARLVRAGVTPGMSDHRVSEALYLSDPDGLGIEIYADRPRSSWTQQGEELTMTTEPLGVQDLLRAGADQPWGGMPAGTVIGHVHLFVDDLAEAEAFYHRALGFDKVVWSYPGALFLSAGGYHHHLGTNTWAAGAPRAQPGDARLLEWELVLPSPDEVEAAAESLRADGAQVERAADGWTAADPWGTVLRVRT